MKHLIILLMLILPFYAKTEPQQKSKNENGAFVVAKVIHKEHIVKYYEWNNYYDEDCRKEITSDSYYLIYTDKETFKLARGLIFGTLNSSDIYGKLQVGETYKFKVIGVRIGFFNLYRRIVDVQTKSGKSINVPVNNNEKRTYVVKVTGKELVDGTYLVYTTEGTFKIEDSLIFGRFNSSDVYGMIQVGHYYKFKVFGIRSQLLDTYRNIIDVIPIE